MKNTPAPWFLTDESVTNSIASVGINTNYGIIAEVYLDSKRSRLNAKLIAAAPDLLLFVQSMLDGALSLSHTDPEYNREFIIECQRLIRHAGGES